LTETQRNVIIIAHYVAMLDLLATMAGITTGAGYEANRFFNWISPVSSMYAVAFVVNIIFTVLIIWIFNLINKDSKVVISKRDFGKDMTNLLSVVTFTRFLACPVLWLIMMCGV